MLTVISLSLSPSRLNFAAVRPPGATSNYPQTGAQSVTVNWNGPAAGWTVTADQPWITVHPSSGGGAGAFSVALAGGAGPAASATGTVTFASPSVNVSITVPVTFTLLSADGAPTGVFDTPATNSTGLSGSIAVTGWALDDIAVDRVEIWRDPVPGETGAPPNAAPGDRTGKVFVGLGTFVPGARPDVQAAFPDAPGVYSAGWGYMLLTYGLPGQGNGTYTLYAYALDRADGNVALLGSKTITVDNAHATKPFGAIDTPASGATISGTVTNFGWALTPGTCTIPANGVQVSIDSGPLQPVSYGDARSDIAGAFPGYTNAAAAGGHYTFDTATLTNGLHTIGWIATDNCGRADGIGSRFFTVSNASSALVPAPPAFAPGLKTRPTGGEIRVVRVGQNERLEVPLPGDGPYLADDLPIGSTFDAATNTFMWQPAAGFLGAYDLRFLPAEAGSYGGVRLRVVVGPPIRMTIDTPHAGNVLAASGFAIAGWAVDLGALGGAGIDTLHVWAYPVDRSRAEGKGQGAVFVGVARPDGSRPDVARLYGASFADAGFTLSGTLPPGTYDLVVYAHSAATNTFAGAQTIRIIVR
jgi:hypothetical protein